MVIYNKSNIKNKWVFFLFIFVLNLITAQNDFFSKELFIQKGDTLRYRLLLPKDFSELKSYPLVLFLHGSGERGDDNMLQLVHGSSLFANEKNRDSFPAIVIFPQCPKDGYWSNVKKKPSKKGIEKYRFKKSTKPTPSMKLVLSLMDAMYNKSYVKNNQMYVGGLSMGGMGTFDLLKMRPDMFAAAFAICGGGNPKSNKKYGKKVSLWIFHGGMDDVVDPYFSLRMFTSLEAMNADVKLSYFENDNHNSWDSSFAEPSLLSWLFSKSKK